MPLADGGVAPGTDTLMTDDQKDQHGADKISALCARAVQLSRRLVNQLNACLTDAPGGKTATDTKLGADAVEAQAIADKLVALVNAHKKTGASDVTAY